MKYGFCKKKDLNQILAWFICLQWVRLDSFINTLRSSNQQRVDRQGKRGYQVLDPSTLGSTRSYRCFLPPHRSLRLAILARSRHSADPARRDQEQVPPFNLRSFWSFLNCWSHVSACLSPISLWPRVHHGRRLEHFCICSCFPPRSNAFIRTARGLMGRKKIRPGNDSRG
jgi:hypothetical protein